MVYPEVYIAQVR